MQHGTTFARLRSADFQGAFPTFGELAMTEHHIRLPTKREGEEITRRWADGFDDLCNPICELRHMAKLARRETLIDGDDTRAFAVLKLCEMVEQLYDDYHEIGRSADPRPAVRKIG
jgi:hypothetical protein